MKKINKLIALIFITSLFTCIMNFTEIQTKYSKENHLTKYLTNKSSETSNTNITEDIGTGGRYNWTQTIIFHSNYPNGQDDTVTITYNIKAYASVYNYFNLPTITDLNYKIPSGYKVVSQVWNTNRYGTGDSYNQQILFKYDLRNTTIHLYATWKKEETPIQYVQYKVEWYDIEGNVLKNTETRTGIIGNVASVNENDKKIEGYTFDISNSKNILNITLGQANFLRLYFRQNNDDKEEPETPTDQEKPPISDESSGKEDNTTEEKNPVTADYIFVTITLSIISLISIVIFNIKRKNI